MLLDVEEKGVIEIDAFVQGPGSVATPCVTLWGLESRGRSEAHRGFLDHAWKFDDVRRKDGLERCFCLLVGRAVSKISRSHPQSQRRLNKIL